MPIWEEVSARPAIGRKRGRVLQACSAPCSMESCPKITGPRNFRISKKATRILDVQIAMGAPRNMGRSTLSRKEPLPAVIVTRDHDSTGARISWMKPLLRIAISNTEPTLVKARIEAMPIRQASGFELCTHG